MNLREQIIEFEGWKNEAYPDPLTRGAPWTIGVGHTGPEVFEGLVWGDGLISQTLDEDLGDAIEGTLYAFPWVARLTEPRRAVLFGMAFQMGIPRLSLFKRFLAYARDEKFPQSSGELLDSKWAKQTPSRARRLASQMETGEWS